MTPLPLLCVVLAMSWPALDASDVAIYRSIREPRVVAVQPNHTHKEMVVMPDGAGALGVYENKYGDGYALRSQLDIPLTDLPESVRETVHLGVGFSAPEEIESWLETLES